MFASRHLALVLHKIIPHVKDEATLWLGGTCNLEVEEGFCKQGTVMGNNLDLYFFFPEKTPLDSSVVMTSNVNFYVRPILQLFVQSNTKQENHKNGFVFIFKVIFFFKTNS